MLFLEKNIDDYIPIGSFDRLIPPDYHYLKHDAFAFKKYTIKMSVIHIKDNNYFTKINIPYISQKKYVIKNKLLEKNIDLADDLVDDVNCDLWNNIIHYSDLKICVIRGILQKKYCKKIIHFIENNKHIHNKERHGPGQNVTCDFINLNSCFISNNPEIIKQQDLFKKIDNILFKVFNKGINIYSGLEDKKFDIKKDCGYCLRKHIGSTRFHSDGPEIDIHKREFRTATGIIVLNSDYDGSIFNFPEFNINIKLLEGDMIFFPPYWPSRHGVTNLENDTVRYSVNTWFLADFKVK